MFFLSICFVMVFLGFWNFTDNKFKAIRIENIVLYHWLENFLIVGGLLAILFFLPFAVTVLKGDISITREQIYENGSLMARFGIVNSVFSLVANLTILAQVCSFISLTPFAGRRNPIRSTLLLISSLSYIVYMLAWAGRDGVIFWAMSFLFCFLMFREFLAKSDLKRLKKGIMLILVIIFTPFTMISVARFSTSPAGTGLSLISYAGQQIRNFNDHYQVKAPLQEGRFNFPVFVDFLETINLKKKSTYDRDKYYSYYWENDVMPNVFTTFIGAFMLDFGKSGDLLILSLLAMGVWLCTKRMAVTGTMDFANLVLFVLLYQVVHWGVFYFRQYSVNFYLLVMVLIFSVFKYFGKSTIPWPKRTLWKVKLDPGLSTRI